MFELTAIGLDEAEDRLFGIARRGEDPRPALRDIADDFRGVERRLFVTQGGGLWAPDAPSTIERRHRGGFSGSSTLEKSGALMRALTQKGAPGARERIRKTGAELGADLDQGRYQGDRRSPVIVGARQPAQAAVTLLGYLAGGRA